MKAFIGKIFIASVFLATLSCSSPKPASVVNVDKSGLNHACASPEPQGNFRHWDAFRNKDVAAMIATYDPKSANAPTSADLVTFFDTIKSKGVVTDSITWVATCSLTDGSSYSFYVIVEHTSSKMVEQWYVVTTNANGLLENVE